LWILQGTTNLSANIDDTTWTALPIRSEQEFNMGAIGGEGEQHPHSIARSINNPGYIYLSHDVGGSWRSTDNGETWQKNLDMGLWLQFGQSIEVDPNDPDLVFIIVDQSYNYKANGFEGLYRSRNGGASWELVLQTETKIERTYRHNIAFDLSSINTSQPVQTWYAAFPNNGLYRSDDRGETWTNSPVSSLANHNIIYEVRTHPVNPDIVFIASSLGLYKSTERGANLKRMDNLPENISSICINPNNPDSIFATSYLDGLYLSVDNGNTFTKILSHQSVRLQMNHGYPEQLYLTGSSRNSKYSQDGGNNWIDMPVVNTFPGLGRENGWRRWIDGKLSGIVPNPQNKDEAVAFSRSTIYKTTDGGNSFNESATGWTGNAWSWTDNSMVFDRFDSKKFAFFCNDVGTRITTTGGDWFEESTNSQAAQWYPSQIKWYGTYSGDFFPEEESEIMIASIGGYFKTQLMRTENLGKQWELVTKGASNEEMNLFISFNRDEPNYVYAGSKYSTDTGKTFKPFAFPEVYDSPYVIGMCNSYPEIIYALNKSCTVILRSCDKGQSWTEYANPGWSFRPFDGLPTFAVDPIDPKKVYTLDANRDLASFDGENWTSFKVMDNFENKGPFNFVRNVAVDPNNPAIIYAGMFASGGPVVFRSLDSGKTWMDISYNVSRVPGTLKVNPHTGELFHGTIFGTWIFPAPYENIPKIDSNLLTGLIVYPLKDTLIINENLSLNFEDFTGCLSNQVIEWKSDNTTIAIVDEQGIVTAKGEGECTISAITENGKYYGECHITVANPNSVIGEEFIKEIRIFPNPNINSELSTLQFYLNGASMVTVELFDILGNKQVLLESTYYDSGVNEVEIKTQHLIPGLYFVRISSTKFSSILKFEVIK